MGNEVLQDLYRQTAQASPDGTAVPPDHWGGEYPSIFEVLARMEYKGKKRKLGRLSVKCDAGSATLTLYDQETNKVCFYTDVTITEALRGLERALLEGKADWRVSKGFRRS